MPYLVDVQVANVFRQVLPYAVEAEAAIGHFFDGFFLAPALHDDSINSADCTGAVGTVLTMHEDW